MMKYIIHQNHFYCITIFLQSYIGRFHTNVSVFPRSKLSEFSISNPGSGSNSSEITLPEIILFCPYKFRLVKKTANINIVVIFILAGCLNMVANDRAKRALQWRLAIVRGSACGTIPSVFSPVIQENRRRHSPERFEYE